MSRLTQHLGIMKSWVRLNFEKIAISYDVLHLTRKGESSTRFAFNGYSLYGWDVESSLTLSLRAIGEWKTVKISRK